MSHIPSDWVIRPAHATCCDMSFVGSGFVYLSCAFHPLPWHLTHTPQPGPPPHLNRPVATAGGGVGGGGCRSPGVDDSQVPGSHRKQKAHWDKSSFSPLIRRAARRRRRDADRLERQTWTHDDAVTRPRKIPKIKTRGIIRLTAASLSIASPTGMQLWFMSF